MKDKNIWTPNLSVTSEENGRCVNMVYRQAGGCVFSVRGDAKLIEQNMKEKANCVTFFTILDVHQQLGHLLPGLLNRESTAEPVLALRMHDCKRRQKAHNN